MRSERRRGHTVRIVVSLLRTFEPTPSATWILTSRGGRELNVLIRCEQALVSVP